MNNALVNNDASWIRDLWIGSFTGICGSALMWDNMHKRELWPHFGRLRAFVAGYDFDESNDDQKGWVPYHDFDEMHYENWQRKPGIVDLVYLRSPDKQRAVGVLANRTYNFYTQWDVTKCGAFVWNPTDEKPTGGNGIPDAQEQFELIGYYDGGNTWNDSAYNQSRTAYYINESMQVDVKSKKRYIITYTDPNTLQVVSTEEKYNATGKLNLNFPYLTGTEDRPIILVSVEPKNNKSIEETADSVINKLTPNEMMFLKAQEMELNENGIRIYPNPAEDFVQIELPVDVAQCIVEILTCTGNIVESFEFSGSPFRLNLSNVQSGIYILRVVYDQKIETFKLVVQ